MWKIDSTRPKQRIKTNQNTQSRNNPKSAFLGASMCAPTLSMCMHTRPEIQF